MSHTLAEKILQSHTDETVREPGQIVNCRLSGVLANDITGSLAINSFRAMGAKRVFDKEKIFLVMDHFTPQKDIESANQVLQCRAFAAETGVVHYYEGGNAGVEHALLHLRRPWRVRDGPRVHGYRGGHGHWRTVVQGSSHHQGGIQRGSAPLDRRQGSHAPAYR